MTRRGGAGWGEKAEALPACADTLLPAENGGGLELDELRSFVGGKARMLWRWVALCRRTRQVVAWTLGDHSLQGACDLRASLPKGDRRCATRRDLWDASAAAFPARTHRSCGKEQGETNQVERWFGTLRARTSRLVRKACSFSKRAENHLDAIHFFIATYHLAIQQQATKRHTLPVSHLLGHQVVLYMPQLAEWSEYLIHAMAI